MTPDKPMTVSDELKLCPFCGDTAGVEHWDNEVSILCSNCNTRSAPFFAENEAQAIAAWNARASCPSRDDVERARAILAKHYKARGYPGVADQVLRGDYEGEVNSVPMLSVLEALVLPKAPEISEKTHLERAAVKSRIENGKALGSHGGDNG